MEAIEPNASLEKLRRSSKGKSLKVAKLAPLGSLDEGITIAYFHRNKHSSLHMSQPSQFVGNAWNEGGMAIITQKQKRTIWTEAGHHDASYVGR